MRARVSLFASLILALPNLSSAQTPTDPEWHSAVSRDSRNCGDVVMPRTLLPSSRVCGHGMNGDPTTSAEDLQLASSLSAQRSPLPTEAGMMEITERGRMLSEYDAAAWHSTDAVKALNSEEVKGGHNVARKIDATWVVAYGRLNQTRDKFLITYEATATADPKQFTVKKYEPPQEDTGFYLSAARALETAAAVFTGEKRPYNAAVLPAKAGQLYVYIYPARTEVDVYLIGGDVRYLVSPDGSTLLETRQLHKSIIEYKDFTKSKKAKEGWTTEMGLHNHILDDVPEDTDVFLAMTRKPLVPEMIITWEYTYIVRPDGTIKYEGESAKMFGKKKKN